MSTEASAETFETFEDAGVWEESSEESFDSDDWSKGDGPADEKEKVKDDLKVLDDAQVDGEGKVIKKDEEKPKKEEKEEEKEEESEDEESEEEESEEEEAKEEDKPEDKKPKAKLRMRMGDELFNVEADATFPVKIDGKVENVPVQELINNYSGKTAWDKKFTEIGKEKKNLEYEKANIESQKNRLVEHIKNALDPIKDANKNPLDSLLYLVEISDGDPYATYRRVMEANLEELTSLMDMSETERELHFMKKKDELQGKVAKQRQEKQQKAESFNQVRQKVDALRQAHNLSIDDFVEASDEYEELIREAGLDVKNITEEQVVEYASLKPHVAKVGELLAPYEDNISEEEYGDIITKMATYLRDGKLDIKSLSELIKRNYSVEESVKELNTKVYSKEEKKSQKKKPLKEEPSEYETFEDW